MSDFIHATDGNYILQNGLPLSAGGNVKKTVACDIVIKRNTVKDGSQIVRPYEGVSIKLDDKWEGSILKYELSGRAFYSPEMIRPGVLTYSGETKVVLKSGSHYDVTGVSPRICAETRGDHYGFLYPDAYKENYYFGIKLNGVKWLYEANEDPSGAAWHGRLDLTNHSNGTSEIAYMNLPNVYYLNVAFNASDYTACRNVYLPQCLAMTSGFGYPNTFVAGKKISVLENFYAPYLFISPNDMYFASTVTCSNINLSSIYIPRNTTATLNNCTFISDIWVPAGTKLNNCTVGGKIHYL